MSKIHLSMITLLRKPSIYNQPYLDGWLTVDVVERFATGLYSLYTQT